MSKIQSENKLVSSVKGSQDGTTNAKQTNKNKFSN